MSVLARLSLASLGGVALGVLLVACRPARNTPAKQTGRGAVGAARKPAPSRSAAEAPGEGAAQPEPRSAPDVAELVEDLRGFCEAYYESQRLLGQVAGVAAGEAEELAERLELLRRRQLARRAALTSRVGLPADAEQPRLLAGLKVALGRDPSLVMVPCDDAVASFRLLRSGERRAARRRIFDRSLDTELVMVEQVLIPSYAEYLRRGGGSPVQSLSFVGRVFYVDLGALTELAERGFWGRIDHYRRCGASLERAGAFDGFAGRPRVLLSSAKDALRWRSLEPLVESRAGSSREERVAGFIWDYADRAALRASAELVERERAMGLARSEAVVKELSFLSAIIHGDPLGGLADLLGLALVGREAEQAHARPELVAARRLIGDLLRQIEPALESSLGLDVQEARRLWTLCRSEPPALRRLARQLYRARSAR